MSRRLALGFVIYRPETGFLNRVQRAIESGFDVYIFDNSPEQDLVRNFCADKAKARYITAGKNLGLGFGVSSVCAQAYYQGHSALLFFDQDSIYSEETLSFIEAYYSEHPKLETTHSVVAFNSKDLDRSLDCFENVDLVINSGSLFFLKNLETLSWHNEKYFVDGVDYEFCLRSKMRGFKVGKYSCTPGFDHTTEQADENYSIFGKTYAMRAYSISRILDVSRSSLKLVFTALLGAEFMFALKLMRLWTIYLIVQMLVRFLNLLAKPERSK